MDDIVSEFLVNTCQFKSQPNAMNLEVWRLRLKDESLTLVGSAGDMFTEPLVQLPMMLISWTATKNVSLCQPFDKYLKICHQRIGTQLKCTK
jgi:hypothetical protein